MNRSYRTWVEVLGAGILTVLSCVFLIELGVPLSRAVWGGVAYDLSVTKTDSPDPVVAGTNLTYTVQATNNDPTNSFPIQIKDQATGNLPAGTCFVSVSDTPSGGTCTPLTVGDGGQVDCIGRPPTAPGGTYSVDITVYVCPSVTSLSDTATADGACTGYLDDQGHVAYSAPCTDTNTGDNTPTEPTAVDTKSDLVITQTVSPTTITPGTTVQYTIVVQNLGPSDSAGTQVTQMLTPGMIVKSVNPPAICSGIGTNQLTCNFGTISAPLPAPNGNCCTGGPTSAQIVVTAALGSTASGSEITSTVNASSTGNTLPDPTPPNNTASDTLTVVVETPLLGPLGLLACVLIIFAVGVRLLPKRAARD